MKILLADDNFVSRKLTALLLEQIGDCRHVSNGVEAYEAFVKAYEDKEPYDLVCLDIMMPNMDGQETLKKIRAWEEERDINIENGVKVIMITSLDDKGSILQAFKSGCESYIIKPVEKKKLLDAIHKLNLAV